MSKHQTYWALPPMYRPAKDWHNLTEEVYYKYILSTATAIGWFLLKNIWLMQWKYSALLNPHLPFDQSY